MTSEKDIIKHTIQNDLQIKRLTSPLKPAFGLTEFWHYTIRADGTFTYLANHPDISDHYWGSHLYKMCPLFKHPDQVEPLLILSRAFKDKGYNVSQGEIQEKFHMQLPFNIILKQDGIYHGFGFSVRNPEFPLDSICINQLPRLNQFCEYFMQESASIQKKILDERFNIGKQLGAAFHKPIPLLHTPAGALKDFYKKLKPSRFNHQNFSKREKQCLTLFLQGSSAREIGEKLGLSTRTIETHFVSIKGKLRCRTKSELFKSVQELERFGLFSQ